MFNNKKRVCISNLLALAVLSLAFTHLAFIHSVRAEEPPVDVEEIVVSAAHVPVPRSQVGNAVTILGEDIIRDSQAQFAGDLFRQVPGLAVNRSGNFGGQTQLRMRGAEGNQVLVLIDGVEANDPATSSEFNFAYLLAGDIERIEVLRGAQSALYGGDALAGVINIITKSGADGFEASALAEGGSFGTQHYGGSLRGGQDGYSGALSLNYLDTRGFNIARSGNEKDGHENLTVNFKAAAEPLDNFRFDASVRYVDTETESDPQDFAFPPTPTQGLVIDGDKGTKAEQLYANAAGALSLFEGAWLHHVVAQLTQTESHFLTDGLVTGGNEGERASLAYETTVRFDTPGFADSGHIITFAFEHEALTFENTGPTPMSLQNQKQGSEQNSFSGEYLLRFSERLFLSGSVRHDDNDLFEDATTYRATVAYLMPDIVGRLHASYGTGVKNPNFFELFGFIPALFTGNPNLMAEKSESFDIGWEQKLFDERLVLDVTYFNADLENEIETTFDFVTFLSGVRNMDGKSKRRGVELQLNATPMDGLDLSGSYTFTDAEEPDGNVEVRRPRHMASFNVNYGFMGSRANLNLGIDYNGRQEDAEFIAATPESRVILDDYVLINLSGAYKLTEKVTFFARIENVLDEDYEEVFSYRGAGIGAYAGIRLALGG